MKQTYSLSGCANAIEQLMDIANGGRKRESHDRMQLLNEPARQVIAMLRNPGAHAALLSLHLGDKPQQESAPP